VGRCNLCELEVECDCGCGCVFGSAWFDPGCGVEVEVGSAAGGGGGMRVRVSGGVDGVVWVLTASA